MPPITNYPLYFWRVVVKLFSIGFFVVGSVVISLIGLPLLRLRYSRTGDFQRAGRCLVSWVWRFFVALMSGLGGIRVEVSDRRAFGRLAGAVVVANHPSLLDVVVLISLIPNADCIVNGSLLKTVVRVIVDRLYIPNTLDFDDLVRRSVETLNEGNCLIIFPEGTRTPRIGQPRIHKGAARIALHANCPVVPIRIDGNDKWGLGKHDPWWAFNHTEPYIYRLSILPALNRNNEYAGLPAPIATKRLNDKISAAILPQRTC
jgi:1-acyl-sn-glycerol-3-phosphate acyltransferase